MLLTLRNGTVWSLTDTPEKKHLDALNATRLQPYNTWLMIGIMLPLILLVWIPSWFIIVNDDTLDILWIASAVLIPLFLAIPIIARIGHLMYVRPIGREILLQELRLGRINDMVPDTALSFQLVLPAIEAGTGDPAKQKAISDYFWRVRRTSNLWDWWTISDDIRSYKTILHERLAIYAAACLLTEQCPDFASVLDANLAVFEQEARQAYQEDLMVKIAHTSADLQKYQKEALTSEDYIDGQIAKIHASPEFADYHIVKE